MRWNNLLNTALTKKTWGSRVDEEVRFDLVFSLLTSSSGQFFELYALSGTIFVPSKGVLQERLRQWHHEDYC